MSKRGSFTPAAPNRLYQCSASKPTARGLGTSLSRRNADGSVTLTAAGVAQMQRALRLMDRAQRTASGAAGGAGSVAAQRSPLELAAGAVAVAQHVYDDTVKTGDMAATAHARATLETAKDRLVAMVRPGT